MEQIRVRVQTSLGRDVSVCCKNLTEAHDLIDDELTAWQKLCPQRGQGAMGVIYLGTKIISTRSRGV